MMTALMMSNVQLLEMEFHNVLTYVRNILAVDSQTVLENLISRCVHANKDILEILFKAVKEKNVPVIPIVLMTSYATVICVR